jgi:hypothetical protein
LFQRHDDQLGEVEWDWMVSVLAWASGYDFYEQHELLVGCCRCHGLSVHTAISEAWCDEAKWFLRISLAT